MDFKVLGPVEVARGGDPLPISSRMQRRLLALLLVQAGAPLRTEQLIDALWEGDPPPSAAAGLHTYISRLRRRLGDSSRLASDGYGYRLHVEHDEVDARRFESLADHARLLCDDEPATAAAQLADALALWRGPAYGEFADEPFARTEAVRLEALRRAATEDALAARLATRDPGIIPDLEADAAAHPLRERPQILLMTALALAGRHNDALEHFQQVRRRLAEEAGLEPTPALHRAQADILQQTGDGVPAELTRRAHEGGIPHGGLPRPITSFHGREHETGAVHRALRRDRLVTLTGTGGVGKTRLALQAVASLADRYPDGVRWCELAPAKPDSVDHVVAAALDVTQTGGRNVTESIVDVLAGERILLVLDNCEHVVRSSAQLAQRILRHCPGTTILATSREPLTVDGEQVLTVPPLPLPADRHPATTDAPSAELFVERARSHCADFDPASDATAIGDICHHLDGLPLAIELAAALVPALEPIEIAERLEHRFRLLTHGPHTDPRHRSLGAMVDWSYDLLGSAEQLLFDRLSVFTGGFTLSAAEGVCADEELPPERIAGLLAGLVSRSMVVVDRTTSPARYRLLETLRAYAASRLSERDAEPELRARHATWFVELAEAADVDVRGADEARGVAVLESELPNLRAAHRWTVDADRGDLGLRLAAALYVFAIFRLQDEVFVWSEQAAQLGSSTDHPLRPTVLGATAHGVSNRGELAHATLLAERAIATAPSAEDAPFAALHALSAVALYEGRLVDCQRWTAASRVAAQRRGEAYFCVMAGIHRTLAHVYDGRADEGLAAARSLRTAADRLGNPTQRAWSLYTDAEARGDADPERALQLLEASIALAEPVKGRFIHGVARVASASLRARHGSPQEALAAFPDLITHWLRLDDWVHQWTTLRNLVPLLVRLGADEPAALLHGAQQAAQTAAPTYGVDAERLTEAATVLEQRRGDPAAVAELVAQGRGLSGREAVDLALRTIAEQLAPDGPA